MSLSKRISGLFGVCAVLALVGVAAAAQEPGDVQARIRGHLDAGEFAPALALANAMPQPEARDPMLAAIAQAQARGGARNAALATLNAVQDDRLRTYALDQMSGAAGGPASAAGRAGGAAMADFDTLIDLITTTIAPTTVMMERIPMVEPKRTFNMDCLHFSVDGVNHTSGRDITNFAKIRHRLNTTKTPLDH